MVNTKVPCALQPVSHETIFTLGRTTFSCTVRLHVTKLFVETDRKATIVRFFNVSKLQKIINNSSCFQVKILMILQCANDGVFDRANRSGIGDGGATDE